MAISFLPVITTVTSLAYGVTMIVTSNRSSYKGRGKHGDLGRKHWWFGPGRIARNKAKYLIWYPAYYRSQWVPTHGLYTEILACLGTDKIQRRLKVRTYVCYQSCRAGSRLQ
eukprot:1087331-Ditylum_brightwellii.AAC.1